jgi:integrase
MYQQYDVAVRIVFSFLETNGMSKTVHKYFRHDSNAFKEYLERKGLEYSCPVAQAWLAGVKPALTRIAYLSSRRAIALIEEAVRHGEIRTWHFTYEGESTQCRVRDCYRRLLDEYLARRAREGRQPSTVQMDDIACTRFLVFLQSRGIEEPAFITPEIIKAYHVQAKHRTHAGKNAYTCRIRGFIRFLAERGLVPETLERVFTSEKAPRVRIISILSASQVAAIRSYRTRSSTPSELRSAAMTALALRMGLRSIDICGLRLSDISWEASTISIIQRKTGSPLTLPLPVEVGNALVRYILMGRPPCEIPSVFITLKRPYTATIPSRCYTSSVAILGKKGSAADIRGLHVARRTFASGLLAAGTPVSMISRALGHSDPSSVDEYLATDVSRMRHCAIGLTGIGLVGALA